MYCIIDPDLRLPGAWFPIFALRHTLHIPDWIFFIAKYFASGVILATAFIHVSTEMNITHIC